MTLAVWTNLTVSLDEVPTANALMLKVPDRIYVESPLQPHKSRVGATPGKPPEDANPCASRASSGGRFQLLRAFPSSALAILTGTAVSKSWMYRM